MRDDGRWDERMPKEKLRRKNWVDWLIKLTVKNPINESTFTQLNISQKSAKRI